MRYVNRFGYLLVALVCLGMSSSVLAGTYTYLFEGHIYNTSGAAPFQVGDTFSGSIQYEEIGEQFISIKAFSIEVDGRTIDLSNFTQGIDPDAYLNTRFERNPGSERLTARYVAAPDPDATPCEGYPTCVDWLPGEFEGYALRNLILTVDKSSMPAAHIEIVFGNWLEKVYGEVTSGTILTDFPPMLEPGVEKYWFDGWLSAAGADVPFAGDEFFRGQVEFGVTKDLECTHPFTGEVFSVNYPDIESFSLMIDDRLTITEASNFSAVNVNVCWLLSRDPQVLVLYVHGQGTFGDYDLNVLQLRLDNHNHTVELMVQFGNYGNNISGSVSSGNIRGYFDTPPLDSDGDGVPDEEDNAPSEPNPDQSNVDGDEFADVIDPCPSDFDNNCDPNGSASESIGPDGGAVATDNGAVAMTVPVEALDADTSLSITDMGEGFVLSSDVGQSQALFGVEIQPEGTVFNVPITLVFAWDDIDDDGTVDGTSIQENDLIITKDGVAITGQCQIEALCDQVANTFTFSVSSLSEFTLSGPLDFDNDGIPDDFAGQVDVCPIEDATGFDVDNNGCIDSFGGLVDLLLKLANEGVISNQMVVSLTSKVVSADNSFDKDKVCTAINKFEAFKNEITAQRGKKISPEAASLVTDYANSVIVLLEGQLPVGETC